MPQTNIVFLDIPTTVGNPVSPYTWRVRSNLFSIVSCAYLIINRLYLNYRGFQYQTRWISTVDIETECISLQISPTGTKPSGEPLYTLPAILDYTSAVTPTAVSDSFHIIRYLERRYPSVTPTILPRDLELEWDFLNKFVTEQLIVVGGSLFLYELARTKVPRDLGPFRSRMEVLFKSGWENLQLKGLARETAWKNLETNMSSLLEIPGLDPKGCFLVGDTVSYPDFVIAAMLIWLRNLVSDLEWSRICGWNEGRWAKCFREFSDWQSVDQHPVL